MSRDCHGIAVTYQRIPSGAELYRHGCSQPTLVIADEPHHMAENVAWGRGFVTAFERAVRWLLLSGTPFRSDNEPILGVRYAADGVARPDFAYGYANAVSDGVCRKVVFVPFDGELSWSSNGAVIDASFADDLDERQAAYRHRTAVSAVAGDGLRRMLEDADRQLTSVREHDHAEAGGLVVACDITRARQIAALLRDVTGESATVVTCDDPDAARRLDGFRLGGSRWIIAVNMVSAGVDIPRLRVGVYATVAKTPLLFRQIVGRFVRVSAGRPNDASFLLIPAAPTLLGLASQIEDELRHRLTPTADEERGASEASAEPSSGTFIALDARVQAQGALLSGFLCSDPRQAAAIDELSRSLGLDAREVYRRVIGETAPIPPGPQEETEFERRERLRRERQRLVGRVHHATGRDYAEIQQQINDGVAAGRPVQEHTVAELERAIRLLIRALADERDDEMASAA